jgi:hypothetical protein
MVEMTPEEKDKKDQADANDAKIDADIKRLMDENEKLSSFGRLMVYQRPAVLILIACISSLITGAAQPVTGIVFSKLMGMLSTPEILL